MLIYYLWQTFELNFIFLIEALASKGTLNTSNLSALTYNDGQNIWENP